MSFVSPLGNHDIFHVNHSLKWLLLKPSIHPQNGDARTQDQAPLMQLSEKCNTTSKKKKRKIARSATILTPLTACSLNKKTKPLGRRFCLIWKQQLPYFLKTPSLQRLRVAFGFRDDDLTHVSHSFHNQFLINCC